jgi:hypothetical protein
MYKPGLDSPPMVTRQPLQALLLLYRIAATSNTSTPAPAIVQTTVAPIFRICCVMAISIDLLFVF